jgi:hypothetical protein
MIEKSDEKESKKLNILTEINAYNHAPIDTEEDEVQT